jgi:regulator of sirC expression with transglutaminase-like and TPR domain
MKPEEVTLFSHLVARSEADLDLIRAVLLIAEPEYPALDVSAYVEELDRLGAVASQRIAASPGRPALANVIRYVYEELGFRGNTEDYYDPRNSFLNEVIDRRTGIPISLALVLTEICQRVGIEARGVSFPGHFLVRVDVDGDSVFIDPFDGRLLDRRQIAELHQRATGEEGPIDPRVLAPASKRQVLARILNNLRNIYERAGDRERLLGVLARMQVLRPDDEGRGRRSETPGGGSQRGPSIN